MRDFLLEIGCEEIPASYLAPASAALAEAMKKALAEARLLKKGTVPLEPSGGLSPFSALYTPRRIALFIPGLPDAQEDFTELVQGPSKKIAFDAEGKPTKAGAGFARGQGVPVESLTVQETKSGPYVFAKKTVKGRATAEVLAEALPGIILKLPFPKSMHWAGTAVTFARPIRSILALLGDAVVPFSIGAVTSGRKVYGHPFLAPAAVEIARADAELYKGALRKAFVLADVDERREAIRAQIEKVLAAHGAALSEFDLLEEVTNLVEFPQAVEGTFPEHYLEVPAEVVEAAMMEHQRYFPVRAASGKLLNRFVTVSNRPAASADMIREGNERVLNARLSDAQFFWREDRKKPLESYGQKLAGVTFQEKLGSYAERTRRIGELGLFIAEALGADEATKARVARAAALSKADLVTQMVFEFTSLQGVVGREYAKADGEDPEVAEAIAEHYRPRSVKDDIPKTLTGRILALADKFDSLVGCFAAGLAPTGNQDPYALRRQTVGIIRIIVTSEFVLPLGAVIAKAKSLLPPGLSETTVAEKSVLEFIQDRLYYYYLDSYSHDIVRAALKPGFDDLLDLSRRLESLDELSGTHDWHKLVTAVERTHNITREFAGTGEVDEILLSAPEERELWKLYRDHVREITTLIDERRYPEACKLYEQTFTVPLHVFFEKVFVNVDDLQVRANRLTLLKKINGLFADRVADLSQILIEQR